MKIFINNKPVNFYSHKKKLPADQYNHRLTPEDSVRFSNLKGRVLVEPENTQEVIHVLDHFIGHHMVKVSELTFILHNKKEVIKAVKKQFKLVNAGGGIVEKNGEILLIYRLKKWDLPKGKAKKGETDAECAIREVEEECNIRVKIIEELDTTWHYYVSGSFFEKQKKNLKRTVWYRMECLDDTKMKPQRKEGIVNARWMQPDEVAAAMNNSYESIRYLLKRYYKKAGKEKII